jgi:hypothetical protein
MRPNDEAGDRRSSEQKGEADTKEFDTMTITIDLTPEEEVRLRARASQRGRDLGRYVHDLIAKDIRGPSSPEVDEALAPFRRQVEASGMTDDQLDEFFEEVREEIWREKQGSLSKRDS